MCVFIKVVAAAADSFSTSKSVVIHLFFLWTCEHTHENDTIHFKETLLALWYFYTFCTWMIKTLGLLYAAAPYWLRICNLVTNFIQVLFEHTTLLNPTIRTSRQFIRKWLTIIYEMRPYEQYEQWVCILRIWWDSIFVWLDDGLNARIRADGEKTIHCSY